MLLKIQRLALVLAGLVCAMVSAIPAKAEEMRATDARRFIAGKHFSYNCFEGTSGNGRIYADGSVAGYIQVGGNGPRRYVVLPAGTLRVHGPWLCLLQFHAAQCAGGFAGFAHAAAWPARIDSRQRLRPA
jgi:hypothetical protein